ncbi:MAG: hypothetical protein IKA72_03195 [Clostridia bacterium]|nr:hypothetical protein [Clostridia bacterium]
MSIKPQYNTHRYTRELCKLESQSIVECRLQSGEIASVLTVHAKAVPEEITCFDGEVKYSGKLIVTVVYRDLDGKICRAERGAEFFHKAQNEKITPACFAKAAFVCDGIKTRREGSGFFLSVVVVAKISVYGTLGAEYLVSGEGLELKTTQAQIYKTICVSGETEEEDVFEMDGVKDVLLHSERANVAQAFVSAGKISLVGEVNLSLCLLKDESVCSYERQIPFTVELPIDEWTEKMPVNAKTEIKSAQLTVDTDEETNKSKVSLSLVLYSECLTYLKEEITVCDDLFSTENELIVKRENVGGRYLTNVQRFTERIGGGASLSLSFEGEIGLQSVVNPRVEISFKRTGSSSGDAEGYVEAELLFCGEDGVKATSLTLPFIFPLQAEEGEVEIEGNVYGLSVRRVGDKFEAEGTLKVVVKTYRETSCSFVSAVEEGKAIQKKASALSIYLPTVGDGLWEVAKKLGCKCEDVVKSNPELEFPIKGGERLFIYRQYKND